MTSSQSRFQALDGLRGYFVILTFFVHFIQNAAGFAGLNVGLHPNSENPVRDGLLQWLSQSNYGVSGFFILSGFLIGRMIHSTSFRGFNHFFKSRFLRIYPAFFVSLVISGLIGTYYTHLMDLSLKHIVMNLLFLNGTLVFGEIPSLNFVTWSLFFEAVFYASVPLILYFQNRYVSSKATGLFLSFVTIAFSALLFRMGTVYILFFGGIAMANFTNESLRHFAETVPLKAVLGFYLLATTGYAFYLVPSDAFNFIYLVACSMLIIKAAFSSDNLLAKIFNLQPLRRLGQISYSFYLLHSCLIIAFFKWAKTNLDGMAPETVAFLALPITFLLTLAGSQILYLAVERPYFASRERVAPKEIVRAGQV